MISDAEIKELEALIHARDIDRARDELLGFTKLTFNKFQPTNFHVTYYQILDLFCKGIIKNLMVSVPPQHGKSSGSSIITPADMVGHNPDLKIATVCYSATKARKFGRKVKQLMNEPVYQEIFPDTKLASRKDPDHINTAEEMEIVGYDGYLKYVGYEGGLTGDPVDILLMDDLYKDWKDANSPITRENVVDWYTSTADTRLHNDSQQLIVFTRWHEDDLVGFIEKNHDVITLNNWDDIDKSDPDRWYRINFEAIKTGEPTELDPREKGEILWPSRHSKKKLLKSRKQDPIKFQCLHQGNPKSKAGLLYGESWKTYIDKPPKIVRKNYTDTADTGEDKLCSLTYDVCEDGLCYVVDVKYTDEPMEITEPLIAGTLLKFDVAYSDVESNNGGRGFARKINEMTGNKCTVNWFHQGDNKEGRIKTNAASVMQFIVFPDDWHMRWPEFYNDVTSYKRNFKANKHDDAPDVLTGVFEKKDEIPTQSLFVDYNDL